MVAQDAPDKCLHAIKENGNSDNPWLETYAQRLNDGAPALRQEGLKGNFAPPEKVDGVFSTGEHTVKAGVYVAKGDAQVLASGDAVVYALDHSRVTAKDHTTVFAGDKSTAEMSGEGVVYGKDNAETYGFDKALVYLSGNAEVFAHEQSLVIGSDHSIIYANDNVTSCAVDNTFVWPRSPKPPDMERVLAFDGSVVATDDRLIDGKVVPLPKITLFDNATWVETEPQFHNPVVHRPPSK